MNKMEKRCNTCGSRIHTRDIKPIVSTTDNWGGMGVNNAFGKEFQEALIKAMLKLVNEKFKEGKEL